MRPRIFAQTIPGFRGGGLYFDKQTSTMVSLSWWDTPDAWEALRADPAYTKAMTRLGASMEGVPVSAAYEVRALFDPAERIERDGE